MNSPEPEAPGAPAAPTHVAVIMDGNGRWAAARKLPRIAGHRRGAEAVRASVRACKSMGIRYLTLYAFSSENWKRPQGEVDALMSLLRLYIKKEIKELDENGVRVQFIGRRQGLPGDVVDLIDFAESKTAGNDQLTLTIALNYGGKAEIVEALQQIAKSIEDGSLAPEMIDEALIASHLYTRDMPDPDFIIRTSGEQRLSNFLLWQSAYSELVFLDILWPDFNEEALRDAVRIFEARERRFGASN
ncbi:MAG: isoprenyl transferase [Sphingomonadales bacterium]